MKVKNYLKIEDKIKKKDKFNYLVLIFIVGGIVGFIYEEIFNLVTLHELTYQGFLYGPFLPVYAWGALLLISLKKFKKKPLLVFILAMLITGILEYITGYVMFQIWSQRWWDYTGLFLNIDGYVCFRSVFTFAIGAFLLIYIINPFVVYFLNHYPKIVKIIVKSFICLFILDNIITFIFRY